MATEIERKFLVVGDQWRKESGTRISQGYLGSAEGQEVRVRLTGTQAFLTVKGLPRGGVRKEYEYEIPSRDGAEMLKMCLGFPVEKVRHVVFHDGMKWEVDEFIGENAGLVVAEVELDHEGQELNLPPWVGAEVTEDTRFYNANLASTPFCQWRDRADGASDRVRRPGGT